MHWFYAGRVVDDKSDAISLKKENDMWKEMTGCTGWGWDDMSTTLKKSERALGDGNEDVDEAVHGTTGMFLWLCNSFLKMSSF